MRLPECSNGRRHARDAEQLIRRAFGWRGGYDGEAEFLRIRVIGGFELFNTRPWHNYETWGTGYEVTLTWETDPPVTVRNECLACALETLLVPPQPRAEPDAGRED